MKTIYKYQLEILNDQIIFVPKGGLFLDVKNQDGNLCVWMLVDNQLPLEEIEIYIYGTGTPVPQQPGLYRGTVIIGPFVWHVFSNK